MVAGAIISAVGGLLGAGISKGSSDADRRFQRLAATQGIKWRVQDAKRAGVHPIYALGAPTFNPSPIGDGGAGGILASMGQDIGRSIDATQTEQERMNQRRAELAAVAPYQKEVQALTTEKMRLENAILAKRLTSGTGNPPFPSSTDPYWMDGQANSGLKTGSGRPPLRGSFDGSFPIIDQPQKRTATSPLKVGQEPGAVNDLGFTRTSTGLAPVMSEDAKQRLEEDFLGMLAWNLRNRALPSFSMGMLGNPPPKEALPKGATQWIWNPVYQEWQPRGPTRPGRNPGYWR